MRGKVRFYNDGKGYGFIRPDDSTGDNADDVFFHVSSFGETGDTPVVGDIVEFEIGPGRQGPEGKNVQVVP